MGITSGVPKNGVDIEIKRQWKVPARELQPFIMCSDCLEVSGGAWQSWCRNCETSLAFFARSSNPSLLQASPQFGVSAQSAQLLVSIPPTSSV